MECGVRIFVDGTIVCPKQLVELSRGRNHLHITFEDPFENDFTLLFEKNRSTFLSNAPISEENNCYYHGAYGGQLSALSLCDEGSISGLIVTSDNRFSLVIDPNGNGFRLRPLLFQSCEVSSLNKRHKRQNLLPIPRLPSYYSKYNDGKRRHVELALVADNSMFKKYNEDEEKVIERLQSIAHLVNSLYYPLNVNITLVYVEVWKDEDKFPVKESGDRTLDMFLQYRKTMLKAHPNDNAHMITAIRFEASVVGKAFKGTMCSYDYSGGVDVDHDNSTASVAATVAHEMGHNFGMEHDADYDGTCSCGINARHCIMAPATGTPPPTFWSDCSLRYMYQGFRRGMDFCLKNMPEKVVGGVKCGNGIVDVGEECDCGREVCLNSCCNGKTCKLLGEAECASGDCCDLNTCKLRDRATVCRESTNICDLPEYCNGETNDCPADFFVQDGHICPNREEEFCYQGVCGSRTDQCRKIWGGQAQPAVSDCAATLNPKGNFYGHCGFDVSTQKYSSCAYQNVQCGLLHCDAKTERPIFGDSSFVTPAFSFIRYSGKEYQCHVIKTKLSGSKNNGRDPAMVLDGSQCGHGKTVSQCNDNCHWRGICNNVGNCHCDSGFGGVACEIPGYGGSVNSNTAALYRGLTPSLAFLVFSGLLFVAFVAACIYCRIHKKRNILAEGWIYTKKALNLHGVLIPVRKAPPPPNANRKRDSFSAVWGDATVTYTKNVPSFPPPSIPHLSVPSASSPIELCYDSKAPLVCRSHEVSNYSASTSGEAEICRHPWSRPKVPPPSLPARPLDSAERKLYCELAADAQNKLQNKPITIAPNKPLPPPPIPKTGPITEADSRPNQPPPPPPPPKSFSMRSPFPKRPILVDTLPSVVTQFLETITGPARIDSTHANNSMQLRCAENKQATLLKTDTSNDASTSLNVKKMAAMFDSRTKS